MVDFIMQYQILLIQLIILLIVLSASWILILKLNPKSSKQTNVIYSIIIPSIILVYIVLLLKSMSVNYTARHDTDGSAVYDKIQSNLGR